MASNTIFTLLVIALGVYATGVLRALAARRRTEEPRPITWDAGQALCVFGLFMIFSAAANVAASLMVKRLGYGPRTPQAMALSGILVYVINLPTLLVLWRFAGERQAPGPAFGLGLPIGKSVKIALACFALYLPLQVVFPSVAETVWVRVLNLHPTRQAVLELILRAPVLPMLTMVFSAVVLAPVYEELIFRAFIQKGIEKTLGRWPAICVTAIIFAAVHGSPLVILKVLPFSIALSVAYDRSRSILANILFHAAFNLTSLIAALAAKQAGLDLLI